MASIVKPVLLEQGVLSTLEDLSKLRIIDFTRCNGYWDNSPLRAMKTVGNWLIGTSAYSIAQVDLESYPVRNDWPGWDHVGNHALLAQLLWNQFFYVFGANGTLKFSDAPDFSGSIYLHEQKKRVKVYGDIGQISVSSFVFEVLPRLRKNDLWISVLSKDLVVTVEPFVNIGEQISRMLTNGFGYDEVLQEKRIPTKSNLKQIALF